MIRIRLKGKPKVDLSRVFRKAVRGYKKISKVYAGKKYGSVQFPQQIELKAPAIIETAKKKGIEIVPKTYFRAEIKGEEMDKTKVNIIYPLIPRKPAKGQQVFAYANIKWSPRENALVYYLIEPALSDTEKELLNQIKSTLIERLDVDFAALKKGEAKDYLRKRFEEAVKVMAPLPQQKQQQLLYYIERDFIGLERIEPLMQDTNIEDVSCDGVGIPIYIYHRDPTIGSIRTNIVFENKEYLDSFVNKLTQRCGKTISVASPLVDASLPDGSRLQATLGTDIARRGSNFTLRKFTEEPLTPVHMLKFGTMDAKILAYLWLMAEHGKSTLIAGGTASGKTSLLNALSLFIRPELKIVSIEDTPELRLPHPHWVPQVARQPIAEVEGRKLGEVDMFDLLRESLRQRPDYIIVGEVRGKEAYVLFQQIATGHAGYATIHADTMEKLVDRLTTPPISLPASLIENLDSIVFIVRVKRGDVYVRRVYSVQEVVGFDRERNLPVTNEIFRWDAGRDVFATVNPSIVVKNISDQTGFSEASLQNNIGLKIKVLEWMLKNNITDYRTFAGIMKLYYTNQERLAELMERY